MSQGTRGTSSLLLLGLLSALGPSPTSSIHVYTQREVYGTVGSHVTLSCSFWSSEWISEDISITWHFQAEGTRDSTSIFHYAKGQPYIDDVGSFKERMEWVGNPHRKDGSIVIHNLDYTDNGTFTCDVKNPPDIVGKSSQVTLYVFEKVPTRYGVVLGSIIGAALLLVAVVVALVYLIRYCWLRRQVALQRRLSAMEKGKLQRSAKDASKRSRQGAISANALRLPAPPVTPWTSPATTSRWSTKKPWSRGWEPLPKLDPEQNFDAWRDAAPQGLRPPRKRSKRWHLLLLLQRAA
ncbi:myelin protein P0 [Egretta garzetta]|uniref:myelin protein P0 n=1 Tax=Egretta garzetta TaxID=188379 RepID=UPI00051EFC60|nr:myelin protein P0 [Egretta garzetta]